MNKLLKILVVTICINCSLANANVINQNQGHSIIVTNSADFIKYATQPSSYNTIIIKGQIINLPNIVLKDNLNIYGYNNSSALAMAANISGNLLTVGKNDLIKNVSILVNNFSNNFAISNNQGASFGKLSIDNITTNGEINLHVNDSSTDSVLNVTNVASNLNNMALLNFRWVKVRV